MKDQSGRMGRFSCPCGPGRVVPFSMGKQARPEQSRMGCPSYKVQKPCGFIVSFELVGYNIMERYILQTQVCRLRGVSTQSLLGGPLLFLGLLFRLDGQKTLDSLFKRQGNLVGLDLGSSFSH